MLSRAGLSAALLLVAASACAPAAFAARISESSGDVLSSRPGAAAGDRVAPSAAPNDGSVGFMFAATPTTEFGAKPAALRLSNADRRPGSASDPDGAAPAGDGRTSTRAPADPAAFQAAGVAEPASIGLLSIAVGVLLGWGRSRRSPAN